jgi:hypothetical protein
MMLNASMRRLTYLERSVPNRDEPLPEPDGRRQKIEDLRSEVEKGRRSGKTKPARDFFDRLERKYMKLAAERRTVAPP